MTSSFLLNHKEFTRFARENHKSTYRLRHRSPTPPPPPLSDDVICERSLSMCYLYETSRRLRISGVFVTPVRRATLFIQTFHAMFHYFGVLFNLK